MSEPAADTAPFDAFVTEADGETAGIVVRRDHGDPAGRPCGLVVTPAAGAGRTLDDLTDLARPPVLPAFAYVPH